MSDLLPNECFVVVGGELVHPYAAEEIYRDPENMHVLGPFFSYQEAYDVWKANAYRTIDNAHMRYSYSKGV